MTASDSASMGHLPEAVTSFIGRRRELTATRARLSESRLVTLVGAPGVGKTRLAIEVAAATARAFRGRVWMVHLETVEEPGDVAQTMVTALNVGDHSERSAEEKLISHLGERPALVLLDNCEHVIEAAGLVTARILRSCPKVRFVATSREPMGVSGEHTFLVLPLSAPDPESPPPLEAMCDYESVQLLVERARAVRSDFSLTEDNRRSVAQLCAQLDGLPLAIELAATRLRSLDVPQTVKRLDHRFGFLVRGSRDSRPRQQTLRALMDWSHELCTPEERLLWARLSVFAGAFDLEAIEEVCTGHGIAEEAVADVLDDLVAKSLVAVDRVDGRVVYRMLVTVKQYGADLLTAAGAEEDLRRRHRDHYLRFAQDMAATWLAQDQPEALARLRRNHANLRSALSWSFARPDEARAGAALAAALEYHWYNDVFLSESLGWLEQATEAVPEPTPEREKVLWTAALLAIAQGKIPRAARWLDEYDRLAASLGDASLATRHNHGSALIKLFTGDVHGSLPLFDAAIAGHRAGGEVELELIAELSAIIAFTYAGDYEHARGISAEALATCDTYGERWCLGFVLWATGVLDFRQGNLQAARERARAALRGERDFKRGLVVAYSLELLSWVAAAEGSVKQSARLLAVARSVWITLGADVGFGPGVQGESVATMELVAEQLGEQRYGELVAEHAGISIVEAIDLEPESVVPSPRPAAGDTDAFLPLTAREREVAELIANGKTNKAIAEALIVSPRTIDGHVERIFGKLGFRSRAQIAAWVSERKYPSGSHE